MDCYVKRSEKMEAYKELYQKILIRFLTEQHFESPLPDPENEGADEMKGFEVLKKLKAIAEDDSLDGTQRMKKMNEIVFE